MKRLDEIVPRKLGEILVTHGHSSLTDARLCESLLKDYCGDYKEEISLLILGVKERIAIDLLVSQDAVEKEVLRRLLTRRLRRNSSLNEGDARWVVDSWSHAVRVLASARVGPALEPAAFSALAQTPNVNQTKPRQWTLGIISRCSSAIRSVAFSPLNDVIASGCDDGGVRLWDPETFETRILEERAGPVWSVRFSPNGVLLATVSEREGSGKSRVRVWDLQSNEPLDLGDLGNRSPSLAFSAGGTRLACASAEADGLIRVWNLQSGQMQTLKGAWGGPSSISFSPDGKLLATADAVLSDAPIRLWNLDTGAADVLGYCRRQITSVAFSPDGLNLASGSWDETIRLWNIRTRKANVLGEDCSCVCSLAFSPEGDRLAAWSLDSSIRVWKLSGQRGRTIGCCDNVNDLAFSADGTVLAAASSDGAIRLWDAL